MMIPYEWEILRKKTMNILEFYGICREKEMEYIAISVATDIIDLAFQYKGIPRVEIPKNNVASKRISVISFSLIFPSSEEIEKFIDFLKKYYFD